MANSQHAQFLADARRYLDLAETARADGRMGNAIQCAWRATNAADQLTHACRDKALALEIERAGREKAKRAAK